MHHLGLSLLCNKIIQTTSSSSLISQLFGTNFSEQARQFFVPEVQSINLLVHLSEHNNENQWENENIWAN